MSKFKKSYDDFENTMQSHLLIHCDFVNKMQSEDMQK